jgi:hypothetical protein
MKALLRVLYKWSGVAVLPNHMSKQVCATDNEQRYWEPATTFWRR